MIDIVGAEGLLKTTFKAKAFSHPMVTASRNNRIYFNAEFRKRYYAGVDHLFFQLYKLSDKFYLATSLTSKFNFYKIIAHNNSSFGTISPNFCRVMGRPDVSVRYKAEETECTDQGIRIFELTLFIDDKNDASC